MKYVVALRREAAFEGGRPPLAVREKAARLGFNVDGQQSDRLVVIESDQDLTWLQRVFGDSYIVETEIERTL